MSDQQLNEAEAVLTGLSGGVTVVAKRWTWLGSRTERFHLTEQQLQYIRDKFRRQAEDALSFEVWTEPCCGRLALRVIITAPPPAVGFIGKPRDIGWVCSVCGNYQTR